ncbi:MAG: component of SufBCD complex [Rhodobacteraceae bacterium]|nr:component of SufBCD complex [Paracoccaceae bacterium]
MDWTDTLFELIDMRSFSSLWYWVALAVAWSTASHWILGVPFDMITRARRHEGQAQIDLEDITRININRLLMIGRVSGLWLLGFVAFAHTALLLLAFWYWVELAQAVELIALPMTFVGFLSLAAARGIEQDTLEGEALRRRLMRHRFWVQLIGMLAIFVTAMFGMYQNFVFAPGFGF